jgi:5-methylcytosine-specific restriction protein A
MKLTTLKSRIGTLRQTLPSAPMFPDATPRMRGRAGVERRAAWLRMHPLCCDCKAEHRVTVAMEVDHVVPLWQGGADDESNFASRCVEHHAAKTASEARERASGASRVA